MSRETTRRGCLTLLGAAACSLPGPSHADATADYPDRPVRLVTVFSPGGIPDAVSRALGNRLAMRWKESVVIDNQAGTGGLRAAQAVARAKGDGYTLLMVTESTLTSLPYFHSRLPYDQFEDLVPVATVASLPFVLTASPRLGVRSLAEFVALARSKPGMLSYGSSGVGGTLHLMMELFAQRAGIRLNHIPYKGGMGAVQDLVGGRLDAKFGGVDTASSYIRSGAMTPLAVGSRERSALIPEVPTFIELGYQEFTAVSWVGVLASRGTPEATVAKIADAIAAEIRSGEFSTRLVSQGGVPFATGPADFKQLIRSEYERTGKLVARLNLATLKE